MVPLWARVVVLLAGLTGWGVTMAAYLLAGQLPDALLLGVPGGLILALAPGWKKPTAGGDE